MQEQKLLVISVLNNFLGKPKNTSSLHNTNQYEYNCPSNKCKNDVDKFNLAFNSEKNIYKCWKCKDSGFVHKLVQKYGTREDIKRLELILPAHKNSFVNVFRKKTTNYGTITCPLPEGYTLITKTAKSPSHRSALKYLIEDRCLSFNELIDFNIGYTEVGYYRNRVIIPSFNEQGNVNFFQARSFIKKINPPYYNPDKKAFKDKVVPEVFDIIFNEKNINWDIPIYLVEGVFDAFRIPNSIPMLGKTPSWYLISKIVEHNSTVVVCLDDDAIQDGVDIYQQLSFLGIDVYFVDLSGLGDISYHYEKNGKQAIIDLLQTRKKIDFMYKITQLLK